MLFRRTAALILLAAATLWPASAAQAHDVLKSSNPKENAKVESLTEVVLEFSNSVRFPKVVVNGPDDKNYASGEAERDGHKVIQAVSGPLPAGKYVIAYRIVSSDGHPRTGEVPFTVTAPKTPTESPTPEPSSPEPTPVAASTPPAVDAAPQSSAEDADSGGGGGFLILAIGVGVVAVAAVVTATRRKPNKGE
ncbi:copper resistance protein CopC [Herbidospora galbida]|uniref:Copper resistance protein CopC n=1 Tax=Herbidospora galbida TaxID=2575442 RepID=A0A4U3MLP3_9ACTN|nr:copper resistance CopC family protein [Herbidospora galbida]TKK90391.1 copper resistance protein CopC [Herbidospora galbida]